MATVNLYRIRVAGLTIEKVPGSEREELDVVALAPPDESVELEAGQFKIGDVSITARGLAEDYFREANDVQSPFICEILPDGWTDGQDPIFWGIVEKASYNRRTKRTEFVALSPEVLLKRAQKVPPRSIYEVEAPTWRAHEGGFYRFNVALSTSVEFGDIVSVELDTGEVRGMVWSVVDTPDYRSIGISLPAEVSTLFSAPIVGQAADVFGRNTIIAAADAERLESLFEPTTENSYGRWADLSGTGVEAEWLDGAGNVMVKFPLFGIRYLNDGTAHIRGLVNHNLYPNPATIRLVRTSQGYDERGKALNIRILGRAMYGYAPPWQEDYYDIETLINALLRIGYTNTATEEAGRPLGILPWLVLPVTVRDGLNLGSIWIGAELSDSPLEALRELQLVAKSLIRFKPVIVSGLPRVETEVIPRTAVSEDPTAEPMSFVIEWVESETPRKIDAVVVRPNADYMKPKGDIESVGVWFVNADGSIPMRTYSGDSRTEISEAEARWRGIPKGDNVLELKVPIVPAYRGRPFGGGKVINDEMLVAVAEYYYEWFNTVSREVSGTIHAANPDILGKIVSVDEGEGSYAFQSSLFVSRVTKDFLRNRTDFEGYILPTFIPPQDIAPTAVISGTRTHADSDGDGFVTVTLNGLLSYNPSGNSLVYTWESPVGTNIGTGPYLDHDFANGQHVIKLTVTDPVTGLSDSETTTITVYAGHDLPPEPEPEEDEDTPDPRGYNAEQYEIGDTGYLRFYPNQPSEVALVRWRKSTGVALEEIDWSAGDEAFWYPNGPITPSSYSANANGQFFPFSVPLDELHLSYIELWVEWVNPILTPTVALFTFDADEVAEFTTASLAVDAAGTVFLTAQGDSDTHPTNGVRVYKVVKASGDIPPAPAEYVFYDAFNNPAHNKVIHQGLSYGQQLYVRVDLYNRDTTTVGASTLLTITNTRLEETSETDYVIFDDLERGSFASPVRGTLFFDDSAATRGLNVRYGTNVWAQVWDSENDGSGSGLDADLWDGAEFGDYINQPIRSSDSPSFGQITLGGEGTASTHAVRADRTISAGTGLTGGGALTANRSLALAGQALALHNFPSTGIMVRTGSAAFVARTITGTTNQVDVANGNGVSGNPTLSLPQDIHTAASPTFASMTLTGTLGVSGATTLSSTLSVQNRATLDGGLDVRNASTATTGLRILRGTNTSEGLRVWADDFDVWIESTQDNAGRYGGFRFRHREGGGGTREVLVVDGDEYEVHVAPAGGGKLGINTNEPFGVLDVNGLLYFRGDQTPHLNYTSSIGSIDKQLLSLYVAELWVNTLVSQETRSTVGGSLLVTHSSELVQDLTTAATTITVKHAAFTNGDVVQMQKFNPSGNPVTQIEFLRITSSPTTVTVNGESAYRYNVSRSIHLTPPSPRAWLAGDSVVSTGNGASPGGGFIHLFANTSFFDPSTNLSGPTIVFNQRTGTAYNAVAPRTVIGRLEGYYGVVGSNVWGFGAGSDSNYLRVTDSEIRMVEEGNMVFRVDSEGLFMDGHGTFQGTITAEDGLIAGWKITPTSFYSDTAGVPNVVGMRSLPQAAARAFFAGSSFATGSDAKFYVQNDGFLFAQNANIEGVITANSGRIGSWYIDAAVLHNNGGTDRFTGLRYGTAATTKAFYAGADDSAGTGATFYVQNDGFLFASAGNIAGWKLSTTTLYSDAAGAPNIAGMRVLAHPAGQAFFAGATVATGSDAKFYVQNDGHLYAENASIEGFVRATSGEFTGTVYATSGHFNGQITATTGSIGGWLIGAGLESANGVVTLDPNNESIRVTSANGTVHIGAFDFGQAVPASVATSPALSGATDILVRGIEGTGLTWSTGTTGTRIYTTTEVRTSAVHTFAGTISVSMTRNGEAEATGGSGSITVYLDYKVGTTWTTLGSDTISRSTPGESTKNFSISGTVPSNAADVRVRVTRAANVYTSYASSKVNQTEMRVWLSNPSLTATTSIDFISPSGLSLTGNSGRQVRLDAGTGQVYGYTGRFVNSVQIMETDLGSAHCIIYYDNGKLYAANNTFTSTVVLADLTVVGGGGDI